MTDRDPWLTEKEAAAELRVSAYVVRAERLAERLGFAKVRGRFFYPMSEINAYKAKAVCPAKSNFGSIPTQADITSRGRSGPGLTAVQRARQISEKLSKSSRPSSLTKVVALQPSPAKSA
jgi:hypothetical protein